MGWCPCGGSPFYQVELTYPCVLGTNPLGLFAFSQQHSDIEERTEIEETYLRCFVGTSMS